MWVVGLLKRICLFLKCIRVSLTGIGKNLLKLMVRPHEGERGDLEVVG